MLNRRDLVVSDGGARAERPWDLVIYYFFALFYFFCAAADA